MIKYSATLLSVLLISIGILFFGCKKKEDDDNPPITPVGLGEKLTTNLNVLHDAAVVYIEELEQSGDSAAAFVAMNNWLVTHPEVSQGWFHNVEFLEVEFNNGLKSSINIIPVGDNGEHLTRGGGSGSPAMFNFNDIQTQEIKNEKVLVLIPYPDEFSYGNEIQDIKTLIESGGTDMEAIVKVGPQVKYQDLATFGDYGLIILDVHGVKYGFFLAYIDNSYEADDLWFPEDVINEAFNVHSIPQDKVANGQIEIGLHINTYRDGTASFSFSILITEDYIRQMNVDLSDAVVFGNHCYSGHTADGTAKYNLPAAWRSQGVASYYGYADADSYSAPVQNAFCKDMEQKLIQGLVVDGDTTGSAHLKPDGAEYFEIPTRKYTRAYAQMTVITAPPDPTQVWPLFFQQYFDVDYKYPGCGDDLVDIRDGTVYQTVCIGEQVWMAENLKYDVVGVCYDNNAANCNEYGRLYTLQELTGLQTSTDSTVVQGICPENWHVPSKAEYEELIAFCGGTTDAADKLRSSTGWPTSHSDAFGFGLKPGGHFLGDNSSSDFQHIGTDAKLWTSSEEGGYYVAVNAYHPGIFLGTYSYPDPTWKFSCRCVQD